VNWFKGKMVCFWFMNLYNVKFSKKSYFLFYDAEFIERS
jgi:hypothetical protein